MIINSVEFRIKISDIQALRPIVRYYLNHPDFTDLCLNLVALIDRLSSKDPNLEITEKTFFKLVLFYAKLESIPESTSSILSPIKYNEIPYTSEQTRSQLTIKIYQLLEPTIPVIINSDYPIDEILKLYRFIYDHKVPLNTEIVESVQKTSNLLQANKILSHIDTTEQGLNNEIVIQVLNHTELEKIYLLLLIEEIQPLSYDTLHLLLQHHDIGELYQTIIFIRESKNTQFLNHNLFTYLASTYNPREIYTQLIENRTQQIKSATINPKDIANRFVTERVTSKSDKRQFAAKTITAGLRKALHTRQLQKHHLFQLAKPNNYKHTLNIPNQFRHLVPIKNNLKVIKTITHGSRYIPDILHAGRIYPHDVTQLSGIGCDNDRLRGDGKITCFSASSHEYDPTTSTLALNVDELLKPDTGNLTSSVFFKFCDWPKLLAMKSLNCFSITDKLSINIITDNKHDIYWTFYWEASQILGTKLPHTDYLYHGYEGLDNYITFFIFKPIEKLPKFFREKINTELQQIEAKILLEKFQNLFYEFFKYTEFDFTSSVNLTLASINSLTHDGSYIDFKELRSAISGEDVDFFIQLFQKLTIKALFQNSYFLIAEILAEAKRADSTNIIVYIKEHFGNTLKLPESVEAQKAMTQKHTAFPILLTDTKTQEALTHSAVTPNQIQRLVQRLGHHPNLVEDFLNEHNRDVINLLTKIRHIFNRFSGISSIGLQSALRQHVVDCDEFQQLLSRKVHCQILLYVAALRNSFCGIEREIRNELNEPLHQGKNAFSGTQIFILFSGIHNGVTPSLYHSLLADILSIVPPMLLFVPNNTTADNENFDRRKALKTIDFYHHLFDILKILANEHEHPFEELDEPYSVLNEAYDSKNWTHYNRKLQSIICRASSIDNIDNYGKNIARITEEDILEKRLCLNGFFSHFCLDPAHLLSILANNYGDFRLRLFSLIDYVVETATSDIPQTYNVRILSIQLFYRLKLLEYKLEIDEKISERPLSARQTTRPTSLFHNINSQSDDSLDEPLSPYANSQFLFS